MKELYSEMEDALKTVGPLAAMIGLTKEDTEITLKYVNEMNQKGISGQQAGQALRVLLKNKLKADKLSDYEKGVRDTIQRIASEIECVENGNTPYLTEEKILKPTEIEFSGIVNKTTGQMLKRIQHQIVKICDDDGW